MVFWKLCRSITFKPFVRFGCAASLRTRIDEYFLTMHESTLNFAWTKSQLRHPMDSLDLNLFCPYLANRSSDFDVLPVYELGSMRTSQRYLSQGKITFESKSQNLDPFGQRWSNSVKVKNFSACFRDGVLQ